MERLEPGMVVYVVSAHWLRLWKAYVQYDQYARGGGMAQQHHKEDVHPPTANGNALKLSSEFDVPRPETISNKDLIEREDSEGNPIIAETRVEGEDYEIISARLWTLLHSWYAGGPEIKRSVIELGVRNEKIVEVRPIVLKIRCHSAGSSPTSMNYYPAHSPSINGHHANGNDGAATAAAPKFDFIIQRSRKATLTEVRDYICRKELIEPSKLVLYRHAITEHKQGKQKLLKKYYSTLEDLKLEAVTILSFHHAPDGKGLFGKLGKKFSELRSSKKKDPQMSTSTTTTNNDEGRAESDAIVMHNRVCGLSNLGNTCFMNTSIQCLAHTVPFVEYFLSGRYVADINKVNPLGMKGQIADNYGKLMRDMWSGATCVVPKHLKWIIGKYAPQFSGISQQDSQELLSFLLDGLHEDLNKVIKKPFIEEKDDKEVREDAVVAAEQWDNHLRRNQSVVVNLFQGQYKIPTEKVFDILLFRCKPIGTSGPDPNGVFCLNNAMVPVRYCLKLHKRDYIQSLRVELSKQSGIEPSCLALAEIFRNRIYTFLNDQRNLSFSEVLCKDIYKMVWDRVGHRVKRGWKSELIRQKQAKEQSASSASSSAQTGSSLGTLNQNHHHNKEESPISSPEGSQFGGTEEDDTSSVTDDESDEFPYPFVLRSTNGYGNNCDRCVNNCSGCPLPCDQRVLREIFRTPKYWSEGCSNLVIDWRPEIFKYLVDSDIVDPQFVKNDSSVVVGTETSGDINLHDCLSLFTKNEKLGPNDTWYCPQCKEHIEGNKKLEIWSAPRILIIHLKRFQFLHRHEKISAFVDFPLDNLDLSKWVLHTNGVPPIYQLYAVSNHMGGTGSGHYTACVKNRDRWFLISDSSYHSIDESAVKTSEAYVLFYELKK
eukprot:gene11425-13317_t